MHLGKVGVHEIGQQHLAVQSSSWIRELDVCHSVDGPFLKNTEPCPVVINIRLQNPRRRLRGVMPISFLFLLLHISVRGLLLVAEDGGQQARVFLPVTFAGLSLFAIFLPFIIQLNVFSTEHNALSASCRHSSINGVLKHIQPGLVCRGFGKLVGLGRLGRLSTTTAIVLGLIIAA